MWHGFLLNVTVFSISLQANSFFTLFLLPAKTLFTVGLFNGFPSPDDSNAFLTLVTLNFLEKSEQS